MQKQKLIRITTIPLSLDKLLDGQLSFMSSEYEVIAISSDAESLEKIGHKEQVKTFPLEMTRKITPIKDFFAVIKLYSFLKKEQPLIVHTHTPKAGIVGMMAAKLAGVPCRFHTVAGLPLLEATGPKRRLLDFVETLTYSCATKVYPNSFGLMEIITKNNYCAVDKLKVLANGSTNGINTDYFDVGHFSDHATAQLKQELGIQEGDFVFIFVGRIVADKGINEMVSAFLSLTAQNERCKLLLVGPFEEDLNPVNPEVLSQIETNPSIISIGYKNDVRPYFALAHALVFPSYREGFPNVVMQAGAMGLPCIVSDINGCNEIISEGSNGLIIPVKDEVALFDAMKLLVTDANLYRMLQENARKKIVSRYEQRVVWKALSEEYGSSVG